MSKKGVAKSLGLTLLGIVLFLVKIPGQGQSVFNLIVSMIENIMEPVNAWVLFIFIGVSLFGTICGTCLHAPFITKNERLANCFVDKKMQLVTLLVAFFVIVSYLFLPFDIINTESDALVTMCANMEMLEVYLRPVMKPLLKVPGSAVINMLTGMFVSVTVAVVMAIDQFQKSVYNRRETVIIISCLTIPSMPFTMLVLQNIGEMDHFGIFYLYMCVAALLVSVIVVRLFPIRRFMLAAHLPSRLPAKRTARSGVAR